MDDDELDVEELVEVDEADEDFNFLLLVDVFVFCSAFDFLLFDLLVVSSASLSSVACLLVLLFLLVMLLLLLLFGFVLLAVELVVLD